MSDWFQKAKLIEEAITNTTERRLTALESAARRLSISEQSARHMLRALDFVESLRKGEKELSTRLASLPYPAVLVARKWNEHDSRGLRRYLDAHEAFSIRDLDAAERLARGSAELTDPTAPARHLLEVLHTLRGQVRAGPALRKLLRWSSLNELDDLTDLNWTETTSAYARTLGIVFDATAGSRSVGILVASNSELLGFYERKAKAVWTNAVCASTVSPLLIVLFPSVELRDTALKGMPLPPTAMNGWPDWRQEGQKKRASPAARPGYPNGSTILLTTAETIETDWQT